MKALSEQEIHQLAMQEVGGFLEAEGYEFLAVNSEMKRSPQFVCVKDKVLYFVVVEGCLYPKSPKTYNEERMGKVKIHAEKNSAKLYFAGVGFAHAKDYNLPFKQKQSLCGQFQWTGTNFIVFYSFFFLSVVNPLKKMRPNGISGFALGTSYSVTYLSPSLKAEVLQREIDSVIDLMNASMSTYIEDSAISKVNRGDSLIQVDEHFEKVYAMASEVWEKTQGYFDPTVGALVNAYGFGPDTSYTPISEEQRDEILIFTGWNKTKLTPKKTIRKEHPQVYFDFNALAKGYVVDVIADLLRENGSTSFLVEIGGEIVAEGLSPKSQQPWKVAIDDPRQTEERSFIAVVPLTNQALATSGNYRKYKLDKTTGKRLVHSINPKTGNPFPTEVLSASVTAPTCMEADAFATALMVMPLEKSRALIERESNLEAYWIVETEDGTVEELYSSGFFRE